jgi:hypothetical protein
MSALASSTQAKVDGVYCDCGRYYHTGADLEEHFRIANADDDVELPIHRPVASSRKRRAKVTDARTSADEQDDDNDDEGVGGCRVCVEICIHPRFCVTPRLSLQMPIRRQEEEEEAQEDLNYDSNNYDYDYKYNDFSYDRINETERRTCSCDRSQ